MGLPELVGSGVDSVTVGVGVSVGSVGVGVGSIVSVGVGPGISIKETLSIKLPVQPTVFGEIITVIM